MRIQGVLILLAALAAIPTVSALEQVVVSVPEVTLHVDGAEVELPTDNKLPVEADGEVEVKPIDVSTTQTTCKASTRLNIKNYEEHAPTCTAGTVTAPDAPSEIVKAELDVGLPGAPAQAPAGPAPGLATEAAISQVIAPNETVVLAAAAASASFLVFYAIWRVLKWTGLAAIIPLYSHISDDEILDDPNRAGIYRLIQAEPGISTKDVADRLDLAWGTVTHHLGKLEKRRFVVSKKYGKYRRYFANGAGGSQDKDALAVLRLDRTGDVAQLIRTAPGMTQKAVSQALGVSSSTILWHVKRLEEVNLVRKVREGKLVRYYPGEGMQGVDLIPAVQPITAA